MTTSVSTGERKRRRPALPVPRHRPDPHTAPKHSPRSGVRGSTWWWVQTACMDDERAKVGKVCIHLDLLVDDIEAAVDHLVALGGTDIGARQELPRGRVAVMHDPEGDEFCLLAPPAR